MSRAVRTVAFVLSSLKFGGGERVALSLAHAFKAKGLNVDIVLMSHEGEFLTEAKQHFNVVDLRCNRTWKLPWKLATYLRRERPDALIASFWKLNLCACLARAAYPSVRLLLWEHSPPSKSTNSPTWLYAVTSSLFYQMATKVITVSNGVLEDVSRITFGLRNKLQVIFNPIPAPSSLESSAAKQSVSRRIVWVGRLDAPKNPKLMLEAFAQLPETLGCTLDFIGDGPQRQTLEQRTNELCLQERVRFRGFQPNPYIWMMQSDLLALTSNREGFGNVLVEALYCGLRVVSTDCGGGIHDVLQHDRFGTIVPTGNASALAHAIETSLTNPCDTENQTKGARRFLPELIAEQFLQAMNKQSQKLEV